jgi:1-aminocyclopropane-1-carboxylate deaminase
MRQFSLAILDDFFNNSYLHEFNIPNLNDSNLELFVKRDDLIHKDFSGNKLRKLKYNLKACLENNCEGILTFGGAYSNHLLASASACHYFGIKSIGVVRGEELTATSNKLLERCNNLGMELIFNSRSNFDEMKKITGCTNFNSKEYWVVPEGGANQEGIEGCREIISNSNFDYVVVAQGTSTTSVGILLELTDFQKIIVVPVLKGYDSIGEMKKLLPDDRLFDRLSTKIIVLDQFHFGGYAKTTEDLKQFVNEFNEFNPFKIEPIYTGKVIFALSQWLKSEELIKNKKVLFVHTGGLSQV